MRTTLLNRLLRSSYRRSTDSIFRSSGFDHHHRHVARASLVYRPLTQWETRLWVVELGAYLTCEQNCSLYTNLCSLRQRESCTELSVGNSKHWLVISSYLDQFLILVKHLSASFFSSAFFPVTQLEPLGSPFAGFFGVWDRLANF